MTQSDQPKPAVYVETTIISYLTAWPSRDVVRLAQQQQTKEWWDTSRNSFELVCSELVIQEASAGDASAAAPRINALQGLRLLAISAQAPSLAARLAREIRLPPRAFADALHVSIAATNGIAYL